MQGGQPIHFGSRALTDTEKCYSQIYKEKLRIVFEKIIKHHKADYYVQVLSR